MYSIDKIEENVVVAEEVETGEKLLLKKESFSFPIYDGILFSIEDGRYIQQKEIEFDRRKILREKMEKLKRHE